MNANKAAQLRRIESYFSRPEIHAGIIGGGMSGIAPTDVDLPPEDYRCMDCFERVKGKIAILGDFSEKRRLIL